MHHFLRPGKGYIKPGEVPQGMDQTESMSTSQRPLDTAKKGIKPEPGAESSQPAALRRDLLSKLAGQASSPDNRSDNATQEISASPGDEPSSHRRSYEMKEPLQDDKGRPLTDEQLIAIGRNQEVQKLREVLRTVSRETYKNLPFMFRSLPLTKSSALLGYYSELRSNAYSRVRRSLNGRLERHAFGKKNFNKTKGEARQFIDKLEDFSAYLASLRPQVHGDVSELEYPLGKDSLSRQRDMKKRFKKANEIIESKIKTYNTIDDIKSENLEKIYKEQKDYYKAKIGFADNSLIIGQGIGYAIEREKEAYIHLVWIEEFSRRLTQQQKNQ